MFRLAFVFGVIVFLYLVLLSRVYYLTISSNNYYDKLSLNNTIKTNYLKPIRGNIYDKNGKILAYNELRFSITLKPHLHKKILYEKLHLLSNLFDKDFNKLLKKYRRKNSFYNHEDIIVVDYLKYDQISKYFSKLYLDNVIDVKSSFIRKYPYKDVLAHIVGYVAKANEKEYKDKVVKVTKIIGRSGIEKFYNKELQGVLGKEIVKVDAYNDIIDNLYHKNPSSKDIKLNIDVNLQKYIFNLFKDSNKSGVAIVMGVDGKVLSAVSYPSFDPNLFVKGISYKDWNKLINDIHNPFTNKIIQGLYPPASTIKPAMALAFLHYGIISPFEKIYCPGYIEVGHRKFRDWKKNGHGEVDLIKSIKRSVDVYYYKNSLKLGIDRIDEFLSNLGFGHKTNIDLIGEKKGILPSKEYKRKFNQFWYLGDTVSTSIGQGMFLVTPIQIARYTALIASGYLAKPYIAYKIGDTVINPDIKNILTNKDKQNLKYVQQGMYQVCNDKRGTAYWGLRGIKVKIAGKTGTAQVIGIAQNIKKRAKESELEYLHRSHAWLTTYGPYQNPKYVVTVIIEHGGHGGSSAAPIVKKIYNKLKDMGYVK